MVRTKVKPRNDGNDIVGDRRRRSGLVTEISPFTKLIVVLASFVWIAATLPIVVSAKDLFPKNKLVNIETANRNIKPSFRELKSKSSESTKSTKSTKKSKKQSSAVPSAVPTDIFSSEPTDLPTAEPSETPTAAPTDSPSAGPTETIDAVGPQCEDLSATVLFQSFLGIATDVDEDANDNGVLDAGEDSNNNGKIDSVTGIHNVTFLDGSLNNIDVSFGFSKGDKSVTIEAKASDASLPASGTIIVTDGSGNFCTFEVNLRPLEETILEEIYSLPGNVFEDLFGATGSNEAAFPIYTAQGLVEAPGTYTAENEEGESFQIVISEILPEDDTKIPQEDLESLLLPDPELTQEEINEAEEIGFSGFAFVGKFQKDGNEVMVVAYAYTYDDLSPDYTIFVYADPEGIVFDEENSELDDFVKIKIDIDELLNQIQTESTGSRRRRTQNLFQEEKGGEELLISTKRVAKSDFLSSNVVQRNLGECRVNPKNCKCGTQINSTCIKLARKAFKQAVKRARQIYNAAVQAARKAYGKAKEAAKKWVDKRIKNAAKTCLATAIIAAPGGPLAIAAFAGACVARATAVILAQLAAAIAAAYVILELALGEAGEALQDAIDVASCALETAYESACVDCKECDPCDKDDDCDSKEYPDPHYKMWNREIYDFHGECDMIHVTNEVLDLHTRTETRGGWSAVNQVALRFDDDVLEVFENNTILVNGKPPPDSEFFLDDFYRVQKSGTGVGVTLSGAQSIKFVISSFYGITILIDAHGSDFFESVGMAGTWNKFGFNDRNGTPLEVANTRNAIEYAIEWEVNATRGDPVLFSTPAENNCADKPGSDDDPPPADDEIAAAEKLCGTIVLNPDEIENCIFDVLNAGEESVEDNIAYIQPFERTERCLDPSLQEGQSSDESSDESSKTMPSCADLGGECVFRCDTEVNDCLEGPVCLENADLTVVDSGRRRRRRMEFIEGCSCALPKQPSESPSASSQPSDSPSGAPSGVPTQSFVPTQSLKGSKKSSKSGKKDKKSKSTKSS